MDKLLGYLPDVDPTIAGVITDCTNLVPSGNGMNGAPTALIPTATPALAAECRGATIATKLDDVRRIVAGTATGLYELTGGTWVNQTRVTGGAYTGGTDTRWSYAQFGDATLAANLSDTIQRSNGSGAFADIATAPKAKIIFSVGAFVMALNTSDATYGTSPDRWWCCASFDDTNWTPNISTLANTGRLVSTPGRITAGGRMGEYAVVYKEKSIYVGQFTGAPAVWDFAPIVGGEAGCIGQDAWCDIGALGHFIVGMDSFFIFDGSRPQQIGDGEIRQWFYENSNPSYRYKTQCIHDKQNRTIWVFYPSKNSTICDQAVIYHLTTKKWGKATLNVEAAINYIAGGTTIDGLAAYSATIDGITSYSFDSQFWLAGGRTLATFNTSHQLVSLTGAAGNSSMTVGYAGDDDTRSLLTSVRLRFAQKPVTAVIQTYMRNELGGATTNGTITSMNDGKFDVLDSSRWHSARFDFTGDHQVMAIGAALTPEGNV